MNLHTSETVRSRLADRGKDLGSKSDLADQLNVSRQFLSQVLNGHRLPSPKLARAVGLEPITMYRDISEETA